MNEMKNAFALAEKEQEEKKIKQLKEIILKTLEKLEQKQHEQKALIKEIQILKADVKDFKEGRLDRVKERVEKDPLARKVSVVSIGKKDVDTSSYQHWNVPYVVRYNSSEVIMTEGICRNNTSGTYVLASGTIKFI